MQSLDGTLDLQLRAVLGDVGHLAVAPPGAVDTHHMRINAAGVRRRLEEWPLTTGKLRDRRRDVGGIPFPKRRQRRMRQRAVEIGPDPRLVAQILRLSVAPAE